MVEENDDVRQLGSYCTLMFQIRSDHTTSLTHDALSSCLLFDLCDRWSLCGSLIDHHHRQLPCGGSRNQWRCSTRSSSPVWDSRRCHDLSRRGHLAGRRHVGRCDAMRVQSLATTQTRGKVLMGMLIFEQIQNDGFLFRN